MSDSEGFDGHPLSTLLHMINLHHQSKQHCTVQQWFLIMEVHSYKHIGYPLVGLHRHTQLHCRMLCIWKGKKIEHILLRENTSFE